MKKYYTENGFEIIYKFGAIVPPLKGIDTDYNSEVKEINLDLDSKAGKYILKIFDRALGDSKVAIVFKSTDVQFNPLNKHLINICNNVKGERNKSLKFAKKLSAVTDLRNGNGLFLILIGKKSETYRCIFTRFKADEVITYNELNLFLNYIQEAFTNKSQHYKLAVFEDILSPKAFWQGNAIDKQSTNKNDVSNYWIEDFLSCKPNMTNTEGTRVLTNVMKNILKQDISLEQKEQIVASLVLLKNDKKQITIKSYAEKLDEDTQTLIDEYFNNDEKILNAPFEIDADIYYKQIGDTLTKLDNGALIYVPTFLYNQIITETVNKKGETEIHLNGKLIDKKLQTKKKNAKRSNKEAI